MFQADRVFFQRNPASGLVEWYFLAREGTFGPYPSQEIARTMLNEYIERHKAAKDTGGRTANSPVALCLESKAYDPTVHEYDPMKRKKGKDF